MSVAGSRRGQVLLGTVAIEPNRWGTIRADRSPVTAVTEWTDQLAALPIDGLELWEGHLPPEGTIAASRFAAMRDRLPVRIFNSYVGFDDDDDTARLRAASAAQRCGAVAVKFNVGNDPDAEDAYARRIARWVEQLGGAVAAICECHAGISVAEDPAVAARILHAAGPAERVQALVHTHDDDDLIRAKFDALGDRITHVHVNHLDVAAMTHPRLDAVEDELTRTVDLLRECGFAGSWTLEFVAGLLTDDDRPDALLEQAADDLPLLRRIVERT